MDVSIVIRTKNEAEFIEQTLRKVDEQEFSGSYEVIIVDSESTDSTVDIVKKHGVKFIQLSQKDFTYGRSLNTGARQAKGEFVVSLSAHALPKDKKWLVNLMAGFEDQNVAGVYGRQLSMGDINPFEALQNEDFFGEEKIRFCAKNKGMFKQIHFSNSNCAIRKDVWEEFEFNEEVPYAEDILWQMQVMEAGFSILYVPHAVVYHTHRISIHNVFRNSVGCAYALAVMKEKRQSIFLLIYDMGLFVGLIPYSMFQNVRFVWRNNYRAYVKIAPFYVVSGWLGWLMGRIKYRLKR